VVQSVGRSIDKGVITKPTKTNAGRRAVDLDLIADINSESSTPRSAPTQAYNPIKGYPIKKTAGDSGGLFDVVLAHKFTAISAGLGEAMIDALVSSALAP